jgi:hypothetical protein
MPSPSLLFNPFYLYIVFGFVAFGGCLVPACEDRTALAGMNAEKVLHTEPV